MKRNKKQKPKGKGNSISKKRKVKKRSNVKLFPFYQEDIPFFFLADNVAGDSAEDTFLNNYNGRSKIFIDIRVHLSSGLISKGFFASSQDSIFDFLTEFVRDNRVSFESEAKIKGQSYIIFDCIGYNAGKDDSPPKNITIKYE